MYDLFGKGFYNNSFQKEFKQEKVLTLDGKIVDVPNTPGAKYFLVPLSKIKRWGWSPVLERYEVRFFAEKFERVVMSIQTNEEDNSTESITEVVMWRSIGVE